MTVIPNSHPNPELSGSVFKCLGAQGCLADCQSGLATKNGSRKYFVNSWPMTQPSAAPLLVDSFIHAGLVFFLDTEGLKKEIRKTLFLYMYVCEIYTLLIILVFFEDFNISQCHVKAWWHFKRIISAFPSPSDQPCPHGCLSTTDFIDCLQPERPFIPLFLGPDIWYWQSSIWHWARSTFAPQTGAFGGI